MRSTLIVAGMVLVSACAFAQREEVVRPGSVITVRTDERVYASRVDGRVYRGTVNDDVVDRDGLVAIPRGARVELLVRQVSRNEMVLDLESVDLAGRRYGVRADAEEVRGEHSGPNAAKAVGGGAILGTIVGAIAGGGKGAAIGAVAGAGVGAAFATRGRSVNIPAEYLLSFRLERPLVITPPDHGYDREGRHYHR